MLWLRRLWSFDIVSGEMELSDGLNRLKDHPSSWGLLVSSLCSALNLMGHLKKKLQPLSDCRGMIRKGEFRGGRLMAVGLSGN